MGCGGSSESSTPSRGGEGARRNDHSPKASAYVKPPPDKNYRAKEVSAHLLNGDGKDGESVSTVRQVNVKINVKIDDTKKHGFELDVRRNAKKYDSAPPKPDGLWEDPGFPFKRAMAGLDAAGLQFKRPDEVMDDPRLFIDGAGRFDVGQGSVGTCYFLGMLAAVAERPELLSRVVPDDAWDAEQGVFHCNFWRFGEWVTVHVDDRLPVKGSSLWGARSATNGNEMWISLTEKAFAKMGGSYGTVWGGDPGQAFVALTGGVAERLTNTECEPATLFARCKNAISSGGFLSATTLATSDGKQGLIGGHCYTVSGVAAVTSSDDKTVRLFKLRNPWGTGAGEWTGPWSDMSADWDTVSDETKQSLVGSGREDGEFWMNTRDFLKLYEYTYICNLTPDMDADGDTDGLTECASILGEWGEGKCGGAEQKHLNPVFTFDVETDREDDIVPLCIQFIQTVDEFKEHMRADLYEVLLQRKGQLVLNEITNDTTYLAAIDFSYRYKLKRGTFALIPNTYEPARGEQFILRLFSTQLLRPVYHDKVELFMSDLPDHEYANEFRWKTIGQWNPGSNNGGVIGKGDFGVNPQLEVKLNHPTKAILSLMQRVESQTVAIGYFLYKLEDSDRPPLNDGRLRQLHGQKTHKSKFIQHVEATGECELEAGRYVAVFFADGLTASRAFAISIMTSAPVDLSPSQMGQ